MEATQHAVFDLGRLLDAGDGAVVVLEAGETRLAAHRAVLAHSSAVFAAMLEAGAGAVHVPDVEGPVLRLLLAYCYTRQAPRLPGEAARLLAAADKYGVSELKAACERQVAAQLSVETAAAAAVLAVRHNCSSLREAAAAYIKSHVFEVMATRGWADAVRTQHEEVLEVSLLLSDTSAPPPADSGTCPPPGHRRRRRRRQTPAPAAARHTHPPDDAIARLRNLPAEEKNRRLVAAAKQGATGELEALLAAGADAGAADEEMRTALRWAAEKGHEEAARRLLAAGAAVGARENIGLKATPLHWAAGEGHAAVVRLLLAAGADHEDRDMFGGTALHWAAFSGRTGAAVALLEGGANRAARDSYGRTPLDTARWTKKRQVEQLLQAGSG